jgi:hypothetical protein
MTDEQLSRAMSQAGRKGGKARARKLTPEQRRAIALKASQAAAKKRSAEAKKRKKAKKKAS